jgi:PPOX class probable F420-dependent enzyme
VNVLNDRAREVIASGRHAHLTTLNPDGSPQTTVVWVGLDGDELVASHLFESRKVRNIRNDPRVSLSIEAGFVDTAIGFDANLVIYGTARIQEGGAFELLGRLAKVYMGPDYVFRSPVEPPPAGFVTRVSVDRVAGIGPWS